jgi:hypothetical protein
MHLAHPPHVMNPGDRRYDRTFTGPFRAEDGLSDDVIDLVAVVMAVVLVTLIALAC